MIFFTRDALLNSTAMLCMYDETFLRWRSRPPCGLRCTKEILTYDDRAADQIKKEYPDKTLCQDCYLEVELGANLAKADLANNWKPGTALKRMAALYGLSVITDD